MASTVGAKVQQQQQQQPLCSALLFSASSCSSCSSSSQLDVDKGNKCGKCQNHELEVSKKGHARDCPFKRCECLKCRLLDARSDILQVISGKETKLKGTKKDPNCGFCQNHGIKILRKGHVRSCGFGQERHFKLENCFDCEVHYIRNEVNRLQIKMRRAMKEDRTLSEEQRKTAREAITRDEVEKVCEMARLARKKRETILSAQQVGEPSALQRSQASSALARHTGGGGSGGSCSSGSRRSAQAKSARAAAAMARALAQQQQQHHQQQFAVNHEAGRGSDDERGQEEDDDDEEEEEEEEDDDDAERHDQDMQRHGIAHAIAHGLNYTLEARRQIRGPPAPAPHQSQGMNLVSRRVADSGQQQRNQAGGVWRPWSQHQVVAAALAAHQQQRQPPGGATGATQTPQTISQANPHNNGLDFPFQVQTICPMDGAPPLANANQFYASSSSSVSPAPLAPFSPPPQQQQQQLAANPLGPLVATGGLPPAGFMCSPAHTPTIVSGAQEMQRAVQAQQQQLQQQQRQQQLFNAIFGLFFARFAENAQQLPQLPQQQQQQQQQQHPPANGERL